MTETLVPLEAEHRYNRSHREVMELVELLAAVSTGETLLEPLSRRSIIWIVIPGSVVSWVAEGWQMYVADALSPQRLAQCALGESQLPTLRIEAHVGHDGHPLLPERLQEASLI